MASVKEMFTKKGERFYQITVSRKHGETPYRTRWYVPEGKSNAWIQRQLNKEVAEFELKCRSGQVQTRAQKKEAEAKAKAEEAAEAKKIQTVKQYCESVYMPLKAITFSENARSCYQGMLNNHIYPSLGDLKLQEVASEQIQAMLIALQSEKHLAHASCVKVYNLCNDLFKKAYRSHVIKQNPMDFVDRPKPMKTEGKDTTIKAYNEKELAYILRCISEEPAEPLKWRAFITTLMFTGMRKGEALGLKWSNVNFDTREITIEHSLNYTPEAGVFLDTTKTGKSRTIPMLEEVASILTELKDTQDNESDITPIDGFVFTQDDYLTPIFPTSPTRYFKNLADKYGIVNFHPHILRHSFASVLLAKGIDTATVAELLGHASPATTEAFYHQCIREDKRAVCEVFSKSIGKKKAS